MTQLNGDFETNTTGWANTGGGTITRQTTTAHTGIASALVAAAGASGDGATATLTGNAAQSSTYTCSAYVQAHAAGDVGKVVNLRVSTTGGTQETFDATSVTLGQGWSLTTVDCAFANSGHTAALVTLRESGAQAAFNFDADTVQFARHLTYLPSGTPFVTGLWVPGVPAGNYNEPTDPTVTTLIASGLYAGA